MQGRWADVAVGPRSRGLAQSAVDSRVDAALAMAGVSSLAGRAPWELSGGEKRAVSMAAVLALLPSILLCDEPSAGLDPISRRTLIGLSSPRCQEPSWLPPTTLT